MIDSADELVRLRTSDSIEEQTRATHEAAPIDVWWEVIRRFPDMKTWVIHNKTVPVEILETLSADSDEMVRWHVANKRRAPADVLERLARDPAASVRQRVAFNSKTPADVLRLLVDDEWAETATKARERLRELG